MKRSTMGSDNLYGPGHEQHWNETAGHFGVDPHVERGKATYGREFSTNSVVLFFTYVVDYTGWVLFENF